MFHFGALIRFWIQTYFDLLLTSILSIKHTDSSSTIQVIDAIASGFIIVFAI
jgi:hypothetical protein